jgi:hypothetical protein
MPGAGAYTARRLTHAFLRWAMRNKLLVPVTIPHHNTQRPAPISQAQRLATIQRLLTDDDLPLLTRIASTLTLLYAQPVTRILRLTIDDIVNHDGEVSIRLGDPPTPVPEPFAGLLLEHIDHRLNFTTATNHDARWLFPGRRGGQPMTPDTIETRFRHAGIPAPSGRTAALRRLVLQASAPVVAKMLGYTHDHTAGLVAEVGGTWTPLRGRRPHTVTQTASPTSNTRQSITRAHQFHTRSTAAKASWGEAYHACTTQPGPPSQGRTVCRVFVTLGAPLRCCGAGCSPCR